MRRYLLSLVFVLLWGAAALAQSGERPFLFPDSIPDFSFKSKPFGKNPFSINPDSLHLQRDPLLGKYPFLALKSRRNVPIDNMPVITVPSRGVDYKLLIVKPDNSVKYYIRNLAAGDHTPYSVR